MIDRVKSVLKRTWINRAYILRETTKYAGGLFGLFGLIALLTPTDEILPSTWDLIIRILVSLCIVGAVYLVILVIVTGFIFKRNRVSVLSVQKGYNLYLEYGDLFSTPLSDGTTRTTEAQNVIIPVNCCFDTIVDDDLISHSKLHGKAVAKLLNKMQIGDLDNQIDQQLINVKFIELQPTFKRKGKLKRYPFGTIVEISFDNNQRYFLLALTELNSDLHAEIHNRENYVVAIQRMIEYICKRSQGIPTVLPLIGGGLSEISTSEQVILDMLVQAFKTNIDKINCDIHIVVRENGKDAIRITGY